MKQIVRCFIVAAIIFLSQSVQAQDTLPKFSVRNLGKNRIVIGWVNNYPVVKQISIQRSRDSLKNFTTILSVTDPTAITNGFADKTAPNDSMFYRLFVNVDKGVFYFTEAKKPISDSMKTVTNPVIEKIKDTINTTRQPVIKKPDFVPSFYVYTRKDGYVFLNLPDAQRKNYHIKFYEEDDSFLFELKNLKEAALTLDKANFIHSGWFKFELYADDKLLEKNKFYLPREY
jgi:hypothetical protein